MFDIGWSELLVIAVVALVVIGPKDLPATLRTVGRMVGKMKRMAADFQGQFNEAMREAELDGLRKELDELKRTANQSLSAPNPLALAQSELNSAVEPPKPAVPAPSESVIAAPPPEPVVELAPPKKTRRTPVRRGSASEKPQNPAKRKAAKAVESETELAAPRPADLPLPANPEVEAHFDEGGPSK